jgi:hypothetical protein
MAVSGLMGCVPGFCHLITWTDSVDSFNPWPRGQAQNLASRPRVKLKSLLWRKGTVNPRRKPVGVSKSAHFFINLIFN